MRLIALEDDQPFIFEQEIKTFVLFIARRSYKSAAAIYIADKTARRRNTHFLTRPPVCFLHLLERMMMISGRIRWLIRLRDGVVDMLHYIHKPVSSAANTQLKAKKKKKIPAAAAAGALASEPQRRNRALKPVLKD